MPKKRRPNTTLKHTSPTTTLNHISPTMFKHASPAASTSSLENLSVPVGGHGEFRGEEVESVMKDDDHDDDDDVKGVMGVSDDDDNDDVGMVVALGDEQVETVEDDEQVETVLGEYDSDHQPDVEVEVEMEMQKEQETIPLLHPSTLNSVLNPKRGLHPKSQYLPLNSRPCSSSPPHTSRPRTQYQYQHQHHNQHSHKSLASKLLSYKPRFPKPSFFTHPYNIIRHNPSIHNPNTPNPNTHNSAHAPHAPRPLRRILSLLFHILHPTSPRRVLLLIASVLLCTPVVLLACVVAYGGVPPSYRDVRREEGWGGIGWGMGGVGDDVSPIGAGAGIGSGIGTGAGMDSEFWGGGVMSAKGGGSLRWGGRERVRGGAGARGVGYLRFPDHLWGHGFNNVLQETLFTSYLSYSLNRTYVFEDYTWSRLPLPYTIYDFTLRPTRIPMGAFISGPIVGEPFIPSSSLSSLASNPNGSWDSDSDSDSDPKQQGGSDPTGLLPQTMAISAEHFQRVCSPEDVFVLEYEYPPDVFYHGRNVDRRRVDEDDAGNKSGESGESEEEERKYDLKGPREGLDGVDILRWWGWRMQQDDVRDQKCVEVRERKRRVFDALFFGSPRLLPLYPAIKESPVLKGFKWSRIIRRATDRIASMMMDEAAATNELRSTSATSAISQLPLSPSYANTVSLNSSEEGVDPLATPLPIPIPLHTPISIPTPTPILMPTPTPTPTPTSKSMPTPIPGLVALHLRRGDYKRHCARLAGWESRYMGFNRFEGLVDKFEPWGEDDDGDDDDNDDDDGEWNGGAGAGGRDHESPKDAMMKHYMKHCLPSIPQIVKRLGRVRADHTANHAANLTENLTTNGTKTNPAPAPSHDHHTLNKLYILTNAWPSYISSLRRALEDAGWTNVWSTADFEGGLDGRERGVGVGIDMALAVEKAEVFVGNGFSSMSANIVMLRLASGFNTSTNRFL